MYFFSHLFPEYPLLKGQQVREKIDNLSIRFDSYSQGHRHSEINNIIPAVSNVFLWNTLLGNTRFQSHSKEKGRNIQGHYKTDFLKILFLE